MSARRDNHLVPAALLRPVPAEGSKGRRTPGRGRPEQAASFVGLRQALGHLRRASSLSALFGDATRALCEGVGFDRAVLHRLDGETLVAESAYVRGAPKEAERLLTCARAERPRLRPWSHESELLRRGRALLVQDALSDTRALGLLPAPGARSYVAAPLVSEGLAVGLIHADRRLSDQAVTELDRDVLWAFAEGLAYAAERCVLWGRLRAQSERISSLVRSTEQSVSDLATARIGLEPGVLAGPLPSRRRALDEVALQALLTRRELEVFHMLAEGETNAGIGRRLVVAEGTVKSHVKNLLRKLGAQNRTQAVARYMRPEGVPAEPPVAVPTLRPKARGQARFG